MLEKLELTSGDGAAAAAVIWLHGLGADGHDFEPIVEALAMPCTVRFVFPHAPLRPVTINRGLRMRAWYDILGLEPGAAEDEEGIRASAAAVQALIDAEEARGLPSQRIALAGFSQGGAIALHAALRETRPLGGVLALSTYLPLAATLAAEKAPANQTTPILMAHGRLDAVIPVSVGAASRDCLVAAGYAVDWRAYEMGHAVCAEEVAAIGEFLARALIGVPAR
jgi:phospholipase/carboxylesterase